LAGPPPDQDALIFTPLLMISVFYEGKNAQ